MAIRHGLAGQFGKSESLRRFHKLVLFIMLWCVGVGFCSAILIAYQLKIPGIIAWVGLLCSYPMMKRLDPFVNSLAKERVRYLRGAQAEALVAWLLEDLPDTWHVFNNLMLRPDQDVDHVVVGPGGVFAISTKSHRGLFSLNHDGRIFHNCKPTGFINEAFDLAMLLKDKLVALKGADVPWITPVLAVPFAYVDFDFNKKEVWVVYQENLIEVLEKAPAKLSAKQVQSTVAVLDMIMEQGRRAARDSSNATATAAQIETSGAQS